MQPIRLGSLLKQKGVISEKQLSAALVYQQYQQVPLGVALVQMGIASDSQIRRALRKQTRLRVWAAFVAIFACPFGVCQAQSQIEDLPQYSYTSVADTFYPDASEFDGYAMGATDGLDLLQVASASAWCLSQGMVSSELEIRDIPVHLNLTTGESDSYNVNLSVRF